MRFRTLVPFVGFAALVTACEQLPQPEEAAPLFEKDGRVVLGFEVFVDPPNGTMKIVTGDVRGLAPVAVDQDGIPNTGTLDTVELVTTMTANDIDGTGACGYVNSFCGDVTIRSFYSLPLNNVFSEVTSITPPTGHEGKNSAPAQMGLSDALGLWSYGTIPSNGAQNQLWVFGDTGVPYIVRGRIMADLFPLGVWDTTNWDNATWQ